VEAVWRGDGEAVARVRLAEEVGGAGGSYVLHPALLDACFQPVAAALSASDDTATVYLPIGMDSFDLLGDGNRIRWSHARADRPAATDTLSADIRLFDEAGCLVARMAGMRFKAVSGGARCELAGRIADWIYERTWTPMPLAAAPAAKWQAADLSALAPRLTEHFEELAAAPGLAKYGEFLEQLEAVSALYVRQAFESLQWRSAFQTRFSAEDLRASLGIAERHGRLFGRLLEILAETGCLRRSESGWELISETPYEDPGPLLEALRSRYPEASAEIELVSRSAPHLAASLRGERDGLDLLFPGGSFETAQRLYCDSTLAHLFNTVAAAAVSGVAAQRSHRLRVLEIGAGTGGTTAYVLPKLAGRDIEYAFTDISAAFTARAAERFQQPGVRSEQLDIETDPVRQGFGCRQFDIVIAANVLHATADLSRTLRNVHSLLAPGGALVLLEVTKRQRWLDLTVGLTEGWWRFQDTDLRPDYPTLSVDQWRCLLEREGFDDLVVTPEAPARGLLSRQTMIAARRRPEMQSGRWVLFADAGNAGKHLLGALHAAGADAVLMPPAACPRSREEFVAQIRRWASEGIGGLVHLPGVDSPPETLDGLRQAQAEACGSALQLLWALASSACEKPPRLWMVTRGAQPVTPESGVADPSHATLWGLGLTATLEHPEVPCTLVDLDPAADSMECLVAELLASDGESQVAYRDGQRYVARLVRGVVRPAAVSEDSGHWRWQVSRRGDIDGLEIAPAMHRTPGPGEIAIRVAAAGLNFKDVMNVLGIYPGDAGPLGGECAGTVTAVGAGVDEFKPGDPVLALAPASFSDCAITRSELAAHLPPELTFTDGAAIPVAFLTAAYCLNHVCQIGRGDRVLIHTAAGGVGMAATGIAIAAGAEVFATAGSDAKRKTLRRLGVRHVFDSRTPGFADDIRSLTGGRGVDIVLNSLAGAMRDRSFEVLVPGGVFLEIGKRGVWTPERVAALGKNVRYFVIDWSDTARENPALIGRMLRDITRRVAAGELWLLPCHVFPVREACRAFRFMAQARHTGKIVLASSHVAPAPLFPSNAAYLISGGFGGLGLAVAGWLAARGARHLVLFGRRPPDREQRKLLRNIEQQGVRVLAVEADAADEQQVAGLLEEIRRTMPPLRGIFHCAGVLDDGPLVKQNWPRFRNVFAPKVDGAWNLDRLSRGFPINLFVLFSSAASFFGSRGQANHAAANAFLDALAHYRRANGLPAISIDWGPWAQIGAAARLGVDRGAAARGLGLIDVEAGLEALGRLLASDLVQAGVAPVDWTKLLERFPGAAARYVDLIAGVAKPAKRDAPSSNGRRPLRRILEEALPAKRRTLLDSFAEEQARAVLGLAAGYPIPPSRPLQELGLDSLLAIELRNKLAAAVEKPLPASTLFDHPTLEQLSGYLWRDILGFDVPVPEAVAGGLDMLSAVEQLSDEEADRLFQKLSPVH